MGADEEQRWVLVKIKDDKADSRLKPVRLQPDSALGKDHGRGCGPVEMNHRRLESLEIPDPPFVGGGLPRLDVHWVRPELVAQVAFKGKLRHPRFEGLRRNKRPQDVVRENG
jgi:hypothetical protein